MRQKTAPSSSWHSLSHIPSWLRVLLPSIYLSSSPVRSMKMTSQCHLFFSVSSDKLDMGMLINHLQSFVSEIAPFPTELFFLSFYQFLGVLCQPLVKHSVNNVPVSYLTWLMVFSALQKFLDLYAIKLISFPS